MFVCKIHKLWQQFQFAVVILSDIPTQFSFRAMQALSSSGCNQIVKCFLFYLFNKYIVWLFVSIRGIGICIRRTCPWKRTFFSFSFLFSSIKQRFMFLILRTTVPGMYLAVYFMTLYDDGAENIYLFRTDFSLCGVL